MADTLSTEMDYRIFLRLTTVLAVVWSIFQLYSAGISQPPSMVFRPLHVTLAVALVFASTPALRRYKLGRPLFAPPAEANEDQPDRTVAPRWSRMVDYVGVAAALIAAAYFYFDSDRISERVTFIDPLTRADVWVGVILIILVLEASRRIVGTGLSILAAIFLAYQLWGDLLPAGPLSHRGYSLERFIDMQVLSPQGLFGVPTGVSADYVFYFILFAAFLELSGGGKFFIDLAFAVTGRARGGPAKAAIVGSAMMGSINGSAVANVVSTGVFTIPLMKRTGYPPKFAAAVEAMASTGGQILPPIMGAGAFIMAQFLGWTYPEVVLAAALPAVLYFTAAYFMVDLKAREEDIQTLEDHERTTLRDIADRAHLLLPLGYLVYMILTGRSLMVSAYQAIIAVIIISYLRRATWLNLWSILRALDLGAHRALNVAMPCAVAGVIVGVVTQTNIGVQFTQLIVTLSGGYLFPALVLVMVGSIILGMGMPTTSAYIMAAVLMVPALREFGISPIAAHMFVFYFACMSMLTPPVALAGYAAAGVAGTPLTPTSLLAFRISFAAYLIPYAFIMSPALLLQEGFGPAVLFFSTALVGTYALAVSIIGFGRFKMRMPERVLFFALAVAMIIPEVITDVVAALSIAALLVFQARRERAGRIPVVDSAGSDVADVGSDQAEESTSAHSTRDREGPP